MRSTGALLMSGLVIAAVFSIVLSAQDGGLGSPSAAGGVEAAAQSGVSPGMDLSAPAVLGGDSVPDFIIGPDTGVAPARAMNGVDGGELASGFIFGGFGGGVRMAAGDINGDGVADIVAGMGPGGSLVQLLSGVDAANLGSGHPFGAGFRGGVFVATGDVNGDGRTDIVVGQGPGGGRVMVFSGTNISLLMNVAPFGAGYTGGVTVAAGDVNGDGLADIFAGQATGGAVSLVDAATHAPIASAPVFGAGGVFVALGDVNGDGRADAIMAPGRGNGPVLVYDVLTLTQLAAFVPYPAGFTGGVRVASTDFDGDGLAEIITAPGPGGGSTVRVFSGGTFAAGPSFNAYGPGFNGGVFVAAPARVNTSSEARFTSAAAATFTVGMAGSFTVTTEGSPAVTLITQAGALPAGVIFTNNGDGTATLSGTPTGPGGTFPLTFNASNGVGAASAQNFALTVDASPIFTSASATTFTVGQPGTFTVTAQATPAVTAIVATGTLPPGVTFTDNADGTATLSGMPAAGGSFPLTLTADNGDGPAALQAFVLRVHQAPAITSAAGTAFAVGTAGTFGVTTTGFPVPSITAVGALPAGVTFADNGDGTASIAGTPGPGTGGTYGLTLSSDNGVGAPANLAFTLTVNQAPAFTSDVATTFEIGVSGSFTVTTTGLPVPLIARAGTLPGGVTFTDNGNGTATLAGTPTGTAQSYALNLTATNGVGVDGNQLFTLNVVSTVAPPSAEQDAFTGAVGNTQFVVGAGALGTPHVLVGGNVLANDTGTGTLTAGPAIIASNLGGQVAMSANGTFVYTPPVGVGGSADTFTYTLTDANGTDSAVVTIGVGNVVWYVSAGAAGDGRSHSPFGTMDAAAAASGPGQAIYVHAGSPVGSTVLEAGQTLWGAGADFVFGNLTILASTSPTLGGTVTLANNVLVTGLIVNAGGGDAIVATGLTGTETLNQVSIISGGVGLNLTNLGGSLNLVGGSIAGVAGTDVLVTGGNGTITIGAAITNTLGRSIDVQGRNGGAVTFSGAITDSGQGIVLNANPGSAINFTGGMALATGAFPAFTATAGGTVVATQDNVAIVNTIATTDGTALQVMNTDIGTAGLTFRTISAGLEDTFTLGAGIILENTGTDLQHGGLTVTGTGVPQSGGVIREKTGADGALTDGVGIYLSSTKNPSFNWMELRDLHNSGIVGRNVAGFLLADSVIRIAGTTPGVGEGPIVFGQPNPGGINGLQGLGVLRNTVISDGVEDNVAFYNQSGTMQLLVERTTPNPGDCFIGQDEGIGFGGRGLRIQLEGDATGLATVSRCRFRHNLTTGLLATAADDSNLTLLVTGSPSQTLRSEFTQSGSGQGDEGIVVSNSGNAHLTATIENTLFSGLPDGGIRLAQSSTATDDSLLDATIKDNFFADTGAVSGGSIVARLSGVQSQARLLIDNNKGDTQDGFEQYGLAPGIVITTPDPGTTPQVGVTITNNHVDMMGPDDGGVFGPLGIHVRAENGAMCADLQNNISHWMPPDTSPQGGGIRLEKGAGGSLNLARGIAGELETDPAVVLTANNPPPFAPPPEVYQMITEVFGAVLVVNNGTCQVPPTP